MMTVSRVTSMPTYTVHEPPPRKGETARDPERFVFVRDGFYFWAFLLARCGCCATGCGWRSRSIVVGHVAARRRLLLLGASSTVQFVVGAADRAAGRLRGGDAAALDLARRGWTTLGVVVGDDREAAERRFFDDWAKRAPRSAGIAARRRRRRTIATPVRRGPPSPSDVIGLFPEPGAPR